LVFGYVQDLVLQGETELALDMIEDFMPAVRHHFDIFAVYLKIIHQDLLLEPYSIEEEESLEELPNIQQLVLLIINSSNKEHLTNAEATLIDLFNQNHPLSQVIQSIKNKEKIAANKFIPEYFISRLNINH